MTTLRKTVGVLALILCAHCVSAQPGETDLGEVSAFGGVSTGALGNHGTVGGSAGLALAKYAIAQFEASYLPLGERTLVVRSGQLARSSGLYDFDFAVHVRVPVGRQIEPYAILAPALLYNRYHLQSGSTDARSDVKFGFETGAGLRYYVAHNWGVRGEYRYTIATQNFGRLVGGVFYQFHEGAIPFRFLGRGRRHGAVR
jgi:opacity protein-like surface antigen